MGTEFFKILKKTLKTTLMGTAPSRLVRRNRFKYHLHKESMNKIISGILGIQGYN